MERRFNELEQRLYEDEPPCLGLGGQLFEMMAQPQAEHDKKGRAVHWMFADAVQSFGRDLLGDRLEQANADRADQPGRIRAIHEEPRRLCQEGRYLIASEARSIAPVDTLLGHDDIDR